MKNNTDTQRLLKLQQDLLKSHLQILQVQADWAKDLLNLLQYQALSQQPKKMYAVK